MLISLDVVFTLLQFSLYPLFYYFIIETTVPSVLYELLRDSGDSVRIVVISLVSTPLCSFNCHQDCYSSCGYTQFFLSFPNQSIVMSLRLFVCFSDCLSLVLLLSLRIFVFHCVCVWACVSGCVCLSLFGDAVKKSFL